MLNFCFFTVILSGSFSSDLLFDLSSWVWVFWYFCLRYWRSSLWGDGLSLRELFSSLGLKFSCCNCSLCVFKTSYSNKQFQKFLEDVALALVIPPDDFGEVGFKVVDACTLVLLKWSSMMWCRMLARFPVRFSASPPQVCLENQKWLLICGTHGSKSRHPFCWSATLVSFIKFLLPCQTSHWCQIPSYFTVRFIIARICGWASVTTVATFTFLATKSSPLSKAIRSMLGDFPLASCTMTLLVCRIFFVLSSQKEYVQNVALWLGESDRPSPESTTGSL